MAGPTDHVVEWEGALSDLVSTLQATALPIRIEVIAPGAVGSSAGEVHLIAGGLADAFAGSLRRDDAMAALQRLEGARFLVEYRLPDPESGSLTQAGPSAGGLKERPLPSLMRYCEDYVLTCRLEVARGQDQAVVNYKRGELVNTTIDGKDADDRLPEMLGWPDGTYQIVLPELELPPATSRRRDSQPLPDRRRPATLPGTGAPAAQVKAAAKGPEVTAPFAASKPPAQENLPSVPPVSSLRLSPQPDLGKPATPDASVTQQMTNRGLPSIPAVPPVPQPAPLKPIAPAARPPVTSLPGATKPAAPTLARLASAAKPAAQPVPTAKPALAKPATAPFKLATPVVPTSTKPAVPAVPAKPAAQAAAPVKPAAQAAAPVKPAAQAAAPAKPAAQAAPVKPAAPLPQAAPAKAPASQPAALAKPVAPAPPAAKAPAPAAPAKPVAPDPAMPAPEPALTKPGVAATPAARPVAPPAPAQASSAHPQAVPLPAAKEKVPEAAPAQIVRKAATASRMGAVHPPKPEALPSASNDLKPASGMIEARPSRISHPRPAAAPVEVAEEPPPIARPLTPAPVTPQIVTPRRVRTSARKAPARPVRIYVLMGLAIGIGIVFAYWLYYTMNVGSG